MLKHASMLAAAFGAFCVAPLHGQSTSRDLPRDVRSLAGVTVNRDSAATIRAKLGATRERRLGTGHEVYVSWCYLPPEASSRSSHALLELMSDASDMGTPGRELNVIRLRADAPPVDREGCAPLSALATLGTPAGLHLGLASPEIQARLGRPTRWSADSLIYEFQAKEFLSPDSPEYQIWNTPEYRESCFDAGLPYANVAASLVIVLRDDRVVEIRVERYDRSVC